MPEFDYAFAGFGGGAINLLLAMENLGLLAKAKVLIVEPDSKTADDRTWCFWTNKSDTAWDLHKDQIHQRYKKLELSSGRTVDMGDWRYVQLRSSDVYANAKRIISEHPNIIWKREKVNGLTAEGSQVRLETKASIYTAGLVFDSLPGEKLKADDLIWQSFVGWRIKTKEEHFEPNTCRMMDFSVAQDGSTQFMYLLPSSPYQALVEHTRFGEQILASRYSENEIKKYLSKMGIKDFEIVEREESRIPMTNSLNPKRKRENGNIIKLGSKAGAVKASTGFAFKNMAQHAGEIARALADKKPIPTAYHPFQFRVYDELLLSVLKEDAHYGKPIFEAMFNRLSPKRVFRFLDEKTHFGEDLSIMWNVPWRPFFRAIGRKYLSL